MFGLVLFLVSDQHRLLGIGVRQLLGDHQSGGGQTHAFGGVAGEVDEGLGGDAVGLIERQVDAELLEVLGDDGRRLAEAEIDDRLGV